MDGHNLRQCDGRLKTGLYNEMEGIIFIAFIWNVGLDMFTIFIQKEFKAFKAEKGLAASMKHPGRAAFIWQFVLA